MERGFDKVWEDLLELTKSKNSITTLSQHVFNEISVTSGGIVVISERKLKRRLLRKERVKSFWSILEQKGTLVRADISSPVRMYVGRIIFSLLAHLPYVEYETRPQRLYLMPNNTHLLGTLKKRI